MIILSDYVFEALDTIVNYNIKPNYKSTYGVLVADGYESIILTMVLLDLSWMDSYQVMHSNLTSLCC